MTKKLRQRFQVSILSNEATFQVAFKHHANIERRPRGSFLAHLLLKRIHVVTGVPNLFAEQFAPDRCRFRATQSLWPVEVISLVGVAV